MHCIAIFLLVSVLAAPTDVTVKTLDGETASGKLTQLSASGATVATQTGDRQFERQDLLSIEGAEQARGGKPTVWVDLIDGSQLFADDYSAAAGKATIELVGGQKVELPTRSVASVRFRSQDAELATQWRAIVAAQAGGDQVVRRQVSQRKVEDGNNESQTVTETALDPLEGVVLEVSPEIVKFDFGGDQIDVKREKLEGIVYFQPTKREFPAPVCRLVATDGSHWQLRSVELADGKLAVVSLAGVEFSLPLEEVTKLDYSAGNIIFLSELEADNQDSSISLQPKAMTATFAQLFQLSRKRRFGADGLVLKGIKEARAADPSRKLNDRYSEGLALHATTRVDYRVPEGFKWFRAVAGLDESVGETGHCRLIVIGDNRELLNHEFDAAENYLPISLNLDVSGIRRLTVVVDAGSGIEIGDQINLCEARLTK